MNHIQVMSEDLANKIAAGEVVERPASVVKELVENAIDAQSTVIDVEVEDGGLKRIKVTDNGTGMSRQDSQLAFERHATSKVKTERDLFRIKTLGFRGEALPSIAAVSKVTLETWNGQDEKGTLIRLEGGQVTTVEDAPLRQGTMVEVTDLFFNTPARYKYLKTVHTELSHISDLINRLALAHSTISFRLRHNGRTLLSTSGNGNLLHILAHIYGHQAAKQMLPFQAAHLDFEAEGFLSKPDLTRANRHYLTVIINGRFVKHQGINRAILQAYHTLLPAHRYPVVLLSLKMDPSLLDVNVHPAKLEIRLSKENELLEWLEEEIKRTLREHCLIPSPLSSMKRRTQGQHKPVQQTLDLSLPQEKHSRPEEVQKPNDDNSVHQSHVQHSSQPDQIHDQSGEYTETEGLPVKEEEKLGKQTSHPVTEPPAAKAMEQPVAEQMKRPAEKIPLLYPIGQLHGTYILAQNEEGLYMIDQHAAQERIWYEHFTEKLNQTERASQELAIPLVLEFTAGEAALIKKHQSILEKAGLFLEEFGHHAYMIRSHPNWFPQGEEEALIREMIDFAIHHKGKLEWMTFRDEVAKMMACKQSIKANQYLTRKEMEALLEKLRLSSNPFTCPHGRPITVLLTKYEIEKMFKRVM
ncbi:DNA mismatch repair protein mutL [Caldalkalibacillus thermarum TA2.A1]|uniref:DNA mismatch repair protein MutL n=1 Tax=Caldalkalibacillus thermarum (strain TA2.A1) TaxID=986075 RepID=F5L9P4_CALTT|nr:DNA mismatch repair endonuclease MutL [Caldalkalibacillus thermarum]EGL81893.1 DNA mismatch repair protein mutL [Caldalkalibacillus thermarum TA2.A1]QZT32938.1 DNA mismatch repair endonuclease MutL [Caldalkalibacillus thermarum TA2.A1]